MNVKTSGKMTKSDKMRWLGGIVQNELNRAEGGGEDELQANRQKALNYYFCRPRGDEVADRSKVISSDVADVINATLALLVPMLSTDAIVEFEPNGEEDETSAKAESDVVNAIIIEDNRGFIQIQSAVKDGLLLKNGVMKVSVDERITVLRYEIANVDELQVAQLMTDLRPNQEAERDGDTLTITTTQRQFITNAVPVENISYTSGFIGRLQDVPFFAERIEYSRSDLIELGISKKTVDALSPSSSTNNGAKLARLDTQTDDNDAETKDQEIIDCHECYIMVDMDNDGIGERHRVLVANEQTVLETEPEDMLPYAMGSPFLNPHQITGESLFDHLMQTQDSKTAFMRQLHDNIATVVNGRYVYNPAQASEEDILSPKAGGGIRARDPSAVLPLMVPDVTSGILTGLSYEDQRRTERGGAAIDLLTAQSQIIGETAHGIERQMASREAMTSMMATNFSESMIRDLYLLTHEFMRRFANEPIMVRINGSYQETDPTQWPQRTRLNVRTGMSPGQRGHMQTVLMQHMQLQTQAMQLGMDGVLASAQTIYRTGIDWLRLAGIDNPERLSIDPNSQPALQRIQQTQEAQQEAQQKAEQQAQQDAQAAQALEVAKLQSDNKQHQGDLEHKYYDTNTDAQVAQAKLTGQGVVDLERERIRNESRQQAQIEGGTSRSGGDS